MVIGVISDTHGLIRPAALNALAGSDLMIHAGDVGSAEVLDALATIAPFIAVRGNCDTKGSVASLKETEIITVDGILIKVIHDLKQLKEDPAKEGINIVISGHSHKPLVERVGDVLYLNPGSAGPRRFRLPISVGRIVIDAGHAATSLITLPS